MSLQKGRHSPVPVLPAQGPEPAQRDAAHTAPSLLPLSPGLCSFPGRAQAQGRVWPWHRTPARQGVPAPGTSLTPQGKCEDVSPSCAGGSTPIFTTIHAGRRCASYPHIVPLTPHAYRQHSQLVMVTHHAACSQGMDPAAPGMCGGKWGDTSLNLLREESGLRAAGAVPRVPGLGLWAAGTQPRGR